MTSLQILLTILACLIIVALSGYAIYLQSQVKTKQKEALAKETEEQKLAQSNLDKRNNNIIADIQFIAQSLISEQCEITEGVLRIHHLADALDTDIMQQQEFSTFHSHFNDCKGMAIKESYKDLSKKERFQQDMTRFRLEEKNKDAILKESALVMTYSFSSLKNLH